MSYLYNIHFWTLYRIYMKSTIQLYFITFTLSRQHVNVSKLTSLTLPFTTDPKPFLYNLQFPGNTEGKCGVSVYLMNECLFLVHGEWIVARDKQIAWTAKWFSGDLFVPRYDSYPMNQEKRHSFLIFTMFQTMTLSKILREKLRIQNSHSNGHLT